MAQDANVVQPGPVVVRGLASPGGAPLARLPARLGAQRVKSGVNSGVKEGGLEAVTFIASGSGKPGE